MPRTESQLDISQIIAAISECNIEVLRAHFANKASFNVDYTEAKVSPLMLAIMYLPMDARKAPKVFNFFIDSSNINYTLQNNEYGMSATALTYSAQYGRTQFMDILLAKGAKYTSLNDGASPLYLACMNGHMETVISLVNYYKKIGKSFEETHRSGYTPVMIADKRGHKDIAKYLISQGALKPRAPSNPGLFIVRQGKDPLLFDNYVSGGLYRKEDIGAPIVNQNGEVVSMITGRPPSPL